MLVSAVHQSDSVYIYTFPYSLPLWFITGYWIWFPVLYSRTSLFIHSLYNSLHLLTPNSHSIPPPPPSPLAITSLFSMSVSLFLFYRYVHLYRILVLVFLFVCLFWPSLEACGIPVPWPEIEPRPWQWKRQVLTTGLPGNSHLCHILDSTYKWYHTIFIFLCPTYFT